MIQYFTPNTLGGFSVNFAHYRGENASNVPNNDDGTGNGIRVNYVGGVVSVGAAWAQTEYAAGNTQQGNAYVSWNSPVGKVTALISRDQNGAVSARGAVVGLSAPLGSAGTFKAAYSIHKTDAASRPEAKKLSLG